jgi:hypothetical protein
MELTEPLTGDEMLEVPSRADEMSEGSLSVQVWALALGDSSAQGFETMLAHELAEWTWALKSVLTEQAWT